MVILGRLPHVRMDLTKDAWTSPRSASGWRPSSHKSTATWIGKVGGGHDHDHTRHTRPCHYHPLGWEKDLRNTGDEAPVHRSDLLQHAASKCANMYHQMVVDDDESHTWVTGGGIRGRDLQLGTEMQSVACFPCFLKYLHDACINKIKYLHVNKNR
jgi:hypothetical protein